MRHDHLAQTGQPDPGWQILCGPSAASVRVSVPSEGTITSFLQESGFSMLKPPEGGARAGLIRLWSEWEAGPGRAQISGR